MGMVFDTLAENMSSVANLFTGQKTITESRCDLPSCFFSLTLQLFALLLPILAGRHVCLRRPQHQQQCAYVVTIQQYSSRRPSGLPARLPRPKKGAETRHIPLSHSTYQFRINP